VILIAYYCYYIYDTLLKVEGRIHQRQLQDIILSMLKLREVFFCLCFMCIMIYVVGNRDRDRDSFMNCILGCIFT
jgi:hypothetical protein